jgi:hypothetical protein
VHFLQSSVLVLIQIKNRIRNRSNIVNKTNRGSSPNCALSDHINVSQTQILNLSNCGHLRRPLATVRTGSTEHSIHLERTKYTVNSIIDSDGANQMSLESESSATATFDSAPRCTGQIPTWQFFYSIVSALCQWRHSSDVQPSLS